MYKFKWMSCVTTCQRSCTAYYQSSYLSIVSVHDFFWSICCPIFCLQAHQRRFCLCCQRWRRGTGPGAGSLWFCHCLTCPAAQWTDPAGWWAGCGTQSGPQSRYEVPCPHADSLWTCASPYGGGRRYTQQRRGEGGTKEGQTQMQRGIKIRATTKELPPSPSPLPFCQLFNIGDNHCAQQKVCKLYQHMIKTTFRCSMLDRI